MVRVIKERFQELYEIRNYSERKLGLALEKLPESDPAHRSYRTLQRNLEKADMDYEVLEKCAELLDSNTDYLRGINDTDKDGIIQKLKAADFDEDEIENEMSVMLFDSKGIYIETYHDRSINDRFKRQSTLFNEWLLQSIISHESHENSLVFVNQSTYKSYFELRSSKEGIDENEILIDLQMIARRAIVNEMIDKTQK